MPCSLCHTCTSTAPVTDTFRLPCAVRLLQMLPTFASASDSACLCATTACRPKLHHFMSDDAVWKPETVGHLDLGDAS